jgi:hypothetical protein
MISRRSLAKIASFKAIADNPRCWPLHALRTAILPEVASGLRHAGVYPRGWLAINLYQGIVVIRIANTRPIRPSQSYASAWKLLAPEYSFERSIPICSSSS